MVYIVMAYTVMAYIVMVCIVIADIVMAYTVTAYTVMAYIVMAYEVMAYAVMAYTVMAYIIMAGGRNWAAVPMMPCSARCPPWADASTRRSMPAMPSTMVTCEHAWGQVGGSLAYRQAPLTNATYL